MADITLTYKGATIAELSETGTKTIETSGKYCEADIGLAYVKPGGGGYTASEAFAASGNASGYPATAVTGSIVIENAFTRKWALTETGITGLTLKLTGNLGGYTVRERTASNCRFLQDVLIIVPDYSASAGYNAGIETYAFQNCPALTRVRIINNPKIISSNVFASCANLTDIYVSFSSGDVTGAPWGATNATIHYDTVFDADGEVVT